MPDAELVTKLADAKAEVERSAHVFSDAREAVAEALRRYHELLMDEKGEKHDG